MVKNGVLTVTARALYRADTMSGAVVVIGGTAGICRRLAEGYAAEGRDVVLSGRDAGRAQSVAAKLDGAGTVTGIGLDLAEPDTVAAALAGVGTVDRLVLGAIERDQNAVRSYDLTAATRLVTLKLVGYTQVVHALHDRLSPDASILLFGGLALQRPYAGSTTVSTVNGGVLGLVHTLVCELAPIRVNGLHPGVVGDSPAWKDKPAAVLDPLVARTPIGRLVTMDEVAGAARFLLENTGVSGVNLHVDGGWLLR
jgi:NAD(P)-dependent dehydrogenase (short-subunit alcohol dehydrogenase family)